jgi:iron complex transport system permease protein
VVAAITLFGIGSLAGYVWFGIAGALGAGLLVTAIAARTGQGSSPVTLALVGAALDASLGAITAGILSVNARTFEEFRYWVVGGLSGRDADIAVQVAPFLLAGLLCWPSRCCSARSCCWPPT